MTQRVCVYVWLYSWQVAGRCLRWYARCINWVRRLRLRTCSWPPLVSLLLLATCYKSVCWLNVFVDVVLITQYIEPDIVYVFTIRLTQANSSQYTMLTRVSAKRCPPPSTGCLHRRRIHVHPLTLISRDVISVQLVDGFEWNLTHVHTM